MRALRHHSRLNWVAPACLSLVVVAGSAEWDRLLSPVALLASPPRTPSGDEIGTTQRLWSHGHDNLSKLRTAFKIAMGNHDIIEVECFRDDRPQSTRGESLGYELL
jgi:hypothetical protein